MPDPCQPFAQSRYAQKQVFEIDVDGGGSLCLLDWVCEGRGARGEKWAFEGWRGRNEVWDVSARANAEDVADEGGGELHKAQGGRKRLLLRDNLILSNPNLHARVDTHAIFGTLILVGPLLSSLSNFFIDEFNQMPRLGARDFPTHPTTPLNPTTSSPNPNNTTNANPTTEQKKAQCRKSRHQREQTDEILWTATTIKQNKITIVKFAAKSVEAGRMWIGGMVREEGSVGREFGEGGLIALK